MESMERLVSCGIAVGIEMTDDISGANRYFEVTFTARDKTRYQMIFRRVWDMRWSVENASLYRFGNLHDSPEWVDTNSIYKVENSEYIRYFEKQIMGTYPTDEVAHYIMYDDIDTTLDILAVTKPELVKMD